jgi:hypothetical protein
VDGLTQKAVRRWRRGYVNAAVRCNDVVLLAIAAALTSLAHQRQLKLLEATWKIKRDEEKKRPLQLSRQLIPPPRLFHLKPPKRLAVCAPAFLQESRLTAQPVSSRDWFRAAKEAMQQREGAPRTDGVTWTSHAGTWDGLYNAVRAAEKITATPVRRNNV